MQRRKPKRTAHKKPRPKPAAALRVGPRNDSARRPRTPHGLRIAAIDIGSNSMHMVIVEVTDRLDFRVLSSEKELTRLGSAALLHHRLSRQAMNHTHQVLARYHTIARRLESDVILAYATSAVRECANGPEFCALLKLDLGLDIQVISSQEEARLIYLAVRQAIDLSDNDASGSRPSLIVDIGGGSAEYILATPEKPLLLQSRKLGASRLTQQFLTSDPPRHRELKALQKHIDTQLALILPQVRSAGARRVIGTSGTMQNLVSMCLLQHGEENVRHRVLTEMTREDFAKVYERLITSTLEERRRMPGLDPGRADQIVAGAAVVKYLFDSLAIDRIDVCDRALREGMIINYMQTHWPKVRLSVQVRDPRRRSVIELGRRCNFNEGHGNQVAKLSLLLFDQLATLHRLPAPTRELLEYAALLHDIGWHIGHSGHHKHSQYLIKNGDLEGFSPNEIELIAQVARYHRKSLPKKSHTDFMALAPAHRDVVCKLAAILRIADGLDRGHYGNVTALRTVRRGKSLSIRLTCQAEPELELWGGRQKTDMFEEVFGLHCSFAAKIAT
jgi:exopolyphosphatase / guanosine-5'-triphosphate,3'-diphosphate pyrophosphatase